MFVILNCPPNLPEAPPPYRRLLSEARKQFPGYEVAILPRHWDDAIIQFKVSEYRPKTLLAVYGVKTLLLMLQSRTAGLSREGAKETLLRMLDAFNIDFKPVMEEEDGA